jgi:nucleotide-binding universal stress UspA family protein
MKILVATDGSDASKSIIERTCQIIGNAENTEVKIISVVESLAPMTAEPFAVSAEYYAEIEAAASNQAKSFVEQAKADLQTSCPIFRGNVSQSIVETARNWNADLIVVGSHGYGFWQRTLLGSISNSVVNHAPCSVMIVRRKENENS